MRQLAQAALGAYGLSDARFRLVLDAGNALFRVFDPHPAAAGAASALFEEGQYLLRLHQPNYRTADAIELELAWLAAMRRDADLPVPEPVPALDGKLLTQASIPGGAGERNCSLLRWVKGRSVKLRPQPHHLRSQGQLMARMHNASAKWQPPAGLTPRSYGWDGLFSDDAGSGMPNSEAWALLPPSYLRPFTDVAEKVRQAMDEWGADPAVFGMIHADLGVDANLLFWHGEPRAIDFDEAGLGYFLFDLAVALEYCWGDAAFPRNRDALLDGYVELGSLPEKQLENLELFIAAVEVYWNLWAAGGIHLHPRYREPLSERIERTAGLVFRYLAGC
jgi:Ser/Thr protein kinase RdoA (MazF antagonist)